MRKPDRIDINKDLFLWKDGYTDEGMWPHVKCWNNGQPCCDHKGCMKTGDPLSKKCKECCPVGYNAVWRVKKNTGSCKVGDTWEQCASTNVEDYTIDCTKCNYNVSDDTKGTAYFYYRPPGQKKQIPQTDDSTQKKRVASTLACMPGIDSWGAVKADRAWDLRGPLGMLLLGLGVVTLIIAMFQYMSHKPSKSIAESLAGAVEKVAQSAAPKPAAPALKPLPPA